MSMEFPIFYHARAMLGPFKDHVWPIFTSRPDKALKFSRLGQHGLRQVSMECLLFGPMPGPFLDHAGTMFSLTFLPHQLVF